MARVDLDRATDLIASAIGVLASRDQIPVSPELARERAANATQALAAEFELRPRAGGPLLLAIADQVVRVDVHGDTASDGVEVARVTLFAPAGSIALTTDEVAALVDGLTPTKGVR